MKYKYFTETELACSHCGKCEMDPTFMEMMDLLREKMNFPFIVTSAYRCPQHPIEARKKAPGAHSSGRAIDIAVEGVRAYKLLREALAMGFVGIGVQQKGSGRFIHLDMDFDSDRPMVWSY